MKETNPIEQRIEAIADKWNDIKEAYDKVRVVRILAKEREMPMIDAFIWYMVGLDNLIDDIAFILDPLFADEEKYSQQLIVSLESCIKEWNEIPKEEGIEFMPVEWTPDGTVADNKNAAKLFVASFNNLASSLDLEEGVYTVAILTLPHEPKKNKEVLSWMENAIKVGISPLVRFLIIDTVENPLFNKLSDTYREEVYTLVPDLDMDNVMKQVAAMGDPSDPSTPYRISFVNMMNAMGNEKSKEALSEGKNCIRIAKENEGRDPNWGIQTVVVYIALSNDQLKSKNYEKALEYADQAIESADALIDKVDPLIAYAVSGQANITKAAIYCYPKEWRKAVPYYETAAGRYVKANNVITAIEAYRMAGFCSAKSYGENTVAYLVAGFKLGENADKESLKASTYAVLIRQLLDKSYEDYISYEEIDRIASGVYGEDWEETIKQIWKQSPDAEAVYGDAISVTDVRAERTEN